MNYKDIEVRGYMPQVRTAEEQAHAAAFMGEAKLKGIPTAQQNVYLNYRRNMMRQWPRAAELDSPPPGHPLREFGQSDRESVQNANDAASVPQALVLMNGQMMPNILNSWSQLMLAVNRTPKVEDRINTIYLGLLSRLLGNGEKAAWAKAQANGLTQEDLIYALLNTQQFIFVQ